MYCTYSDLVKEFGENEVNTLLDRDRDSVEDTGVLDEATNFAQTLMDGYFRERYPVPLVTVPRNVIGFACDIARYRLYQDQPTELVQLRYEAAVLWLKDVARGLVTLDIGQAFEKRIAYSEPTSVFTKLVW